MPSGLMDQRQIPSVSISDDRRLPEERKIGFWKQDSVPDRRDDSLFFLGSYSISSLGKLQPIGTKPVDRPELAQQEKMKDHGMKLGLEHQLMGQDMNHHLSPNTWRAPEQDVRSIGSRANLAFEAGCLFLEGRAADLNGSCYENGLFSSSFSEIFDRKLRMAPKIGVIGRSIDKANPSTEESGTSELMEEIEARIIGDILPDDDDLLSAIVDSRSAGRANHGDDIDDDIFCTGGGMELESEDGACGGVVPEINGNGAANGLHFPSGIFNGEHPYGERPSRTLFVRNISSSVEDDELRILFEHYGDIRVLYTASKHRGFVMISYYDIRAARNAMRALQNTPLRHRKLDIHFSIPKDNQSLKDINQGTVAVFNVDPSITNDDLHKIFSCYGEIMEIRESLQRGNHRSVEFYDIRAAEAAMRALHKADIGGKNISMEPIKRLMQQEEFSGCKLASPSSSPSGCFASAFPGLSSSIPHSLSSPVGISSSGIPAIRHSVHSEMSNSVGQTNFGFRPLGALHPHSLPEHGNGSIINGAAYNLSPLSSVGLNGNTRALEEMNLHKLPGHHSNGISLDSNDGAFGHQYTWNNSSSTSHHPTSPLIWSHSPSMLNNLTHLPQPMHGMPRPPPSHILDNVLPINQHHVGSAPSVNPWDRRCGYSGDRMELQSFYPGSLGSMGFSGSPQLHNLELNSIIAHDGGNRIDALASAARVGVSSPQQRGHMFHGRNPVIPMSPLFDAPNDRLRSRRNDSSANQGDNKKQYELDIERIVRGEDLRTTLMIKNIPNKYTSKMLLAAIDENHRGTYDFIYLPIDFKNKCNVGYAFINMTSSQHIIPFYQTFNGKKWEKFNSEKVATLAYARIQGKAALIAHFQNSSLMNEDKRCRPILFHSDGPNAGDQEPFPMGVNIRSRSGRSRNFHGEDNVQVASSASGNGESSYSIRDTSSGSIKDEAP